MFSTRVVQSAQAHAIAEYPKEACGIVLEGEYKPVDNISGDPTAHFQMPVDVGMWLIDAVIHSHCAPEYDLCPSAQDMQGQIATGVPWGIIHTNGQWASQPLWFGEHVLDEPLIGRTFIPGVYDCYSLIRAWYWQEKQIRIPEFPRDVHWWNDGGDLFQAGFQKAGFQRINTEPQFGDVILMQVRSQVPNHGAVMLDGGMLIHHLENRLSRREPFNPWRGRVTHVLRYQRR